MKLINAIFIILVLLLCGILVGIALYHHCIIGIVIDKRANELGMMHYCGEQNKMIAKDEYRWNLKYLKEGTME